MSKPLSALLLVVAFPLALVFAQGLVAPTHLVESHGAQAPPALRDFWSVTLADGIFAVPQDKVLVVTGAALRDPSSTYYGHRLLVGGVPVFGAVLGMDPTGSDFVNAVSIPPPGLLIDSGSSVQVSTEAGDSRVVFVGYLADL